MALLAVRVMLWMDRALLAYLHANRDRVERLCCWVDKIADELRRAHGIRNG